MNAEKKWSCRADSNTRPGDYKSPALPTELQQHIRFLRPMPLARPAPGRAVPKGLRGAAFSSKRKTPYPFTGKALTFSISVSRKPLPFKVLW